MRSEHRVLASPRLVSPERPTHRACLSIAYEARRPFVAWDRLSPSYGGALLRAVGCRELSSYIVSNRTGAQQKPRSFGGLRCRTALLCLKLKNPRSVFKFGGKDDRK